MTERRELEKLRIVLNSLECITTAVPLCRKRVGTDTLMERQS